MITAIIIDDEQGSRDVLKKSVETYCKDVKIVATGNCVDDAIDLIRTFNPDLVFLDIEMPNGNGFTLFERVKNIYFDVIFTTAYDEYAIKAFRVSALDYLTKPIDYRLLQDAINKLKNKNKLLINEQRFALLLENVTTRPDEFNKIALPTGNGYEMVDTANIVYCLADVNYTEVHLLNGKKIVLSKTIKSVEELLPPSTFYRIHRSFVVNLNLIKEYSKEHGNVVIMKTGKMLDVSERNKKAFLEVLSKKQLL